ncbi:MAG: enoyl-CoA hydratase/isomerase family protein, partial [Acetobacteraceae bacterium]|nr:enoyl-CoA hydratase/isomerase family protein [Acetobacteraceae bacterium]
MGSINSCIDLRREGDVALVVIDNPPVNALKHEVRAGLVTAMHQLRDDPAVRAVVLTGSQRAFSGGADITEFGKPPQDPNLRDVITIIEDMPKPITAAIHGLALGGGLELALGCHYRVAWPGSRVGLPEVKLGLLPGAGGTQRLPRIVGPEKALKVIVSGEAISAEQALADGVIDKVLDGPFPDAAIAFAQEVASAPLKRVRDRDEKLIPARADPGLIDRAAEPLLRRTRGAQAPKLCVEAVRAAVTKPFDEGMRIERDLFMQLVSGDESRAQRYIFFAEREAAKIPGMPADVKPKPISRAVVIGAGTMGGGIAMCFANVGIPVTVIEAEDAALKRGMDRVEGNYRTAVSRASMKEGELGKRMELIAPTTDFARVAEGDVVIEAVFEEMDLKKKVFADLDRLAKPGALLATNTSYLNINEIASLTSRPEDILGMHFFSPANVMRLLEIVRAEKSSFQALTTALSVGRTIGKVCAVVGVCDGFVGNRMLAGRTAQSEHLLLEGALPQDVDSALTDFGFPMGPFAMGDLAGLDVGWRIRKQKGVRAPIFDALCEAGRYGQKTGAGFYRYEGRKPTPDSEVERIIVEMSKQQGITRRQVSKQEILERLVYPMINEGARILHEGIAIRPGDIDVIWVYGYGWPVHKGGPMFYGDLVGLPVLQDRLTEY